MLVLRSTKKLRDRLHGRVAGPDDVSTTVLGDWFATALFWRPQVALLVNARTLVPVFLPLAPAAGLPGRVPAAVGAVLREHGVDDAFLRTELAAMTEVRIAPTNDRSVVGVMNEFAFHGGVLVEEGVDDLVELSFRLGSLLLGPLLRRGGSPDRELAAVLHMVLLQQPQECPLAKVAAWQHLQPCWLAHSQLHQLADSSSCISG